MKLFLILCIALKSNYMLRIYILIGKVIKKVVEWMSDEDNQKKLSAIGDFFKNHWPVLLAAYLLFGNSIGRLVVKLGGLAIKWTLKLGALIAKSLIPLAKKLGMKKSLGVGSLISINIESVKD